MIKKNTKTRLKFIELNKKSLNEYFSDLCTYSLNLKFYEFLEYEPFKTESQVRFYFENHLKLCGSDQNFFWLIIDNETNKAIGSARIVGVKSNKSSALIGYGLSPSYHGQGLFKYILKFLERFGFYELGLYKLSAETVIENIPSIKGLLSQGHNIEGLLGGEFINSNGKRRDVLKLSKIGIDN